jgi:hypothetical protein
MKERIMADDRKTERTDSERTETRGQRPVAKLETAAEPAKRNLTQEQVQGYLETRYLDQGKSPEEARVLAEKRARAMCGG